MSIPRIGDRMGTNEGLPLGYRRCEYLESTGTQWIDTDITLEKFGKAVHDIQFTGGSNKYMGFKAESFSFATGLAFGINQEGKIWYCGVNTYEHSDLFNRKLWTLSVDKGISQLSINDIFIGKKTLPDTNEVTIYSVFSGLSQVESIKAKIYTVKIYDRNSVLQLNLIPALDPNNRPCMFDTVTSTPLYNQGTDEFLYKVISPETAYIPANFTRVGYLESNGTQYIDTGIKLSNESEVRCEYELEQSAFTGYLYGACTSHSVDDFSFLANLENTNVVHFYAGTERVVSLNQTNIGKISSVQTAKTVHIGASVKSYSKPEEAFISGRTATIWCKNGAHLATARIYSFSISCNGQLQCNLIPCLDGDDVPCMYDTVSQTALYKVAGDQFLYGEDEEVSKKLPAGYTKMNYLESTGTQWIDTGIKLSNESEVKCKFIMLSDAKSSGLFGAREAYLQKAYCCFAPASNKLVLAQFYNGEGTFAGSAVNELYLLQKVIREWRLNDKKIQVGTHQFEGSYPSYLFAVNDGGKLNHSILTGRVYSFSISRNGELQLDLQPCLDPYGVPCMYDFVSKRPLYKEDNGDDGDQFLYG